MTQSEGKDSSLDVLKRKIDQMKSNGQQEDEPATKQASNVGKALHMATELLAAVGVGGIMGYGLDSLFGTSPVLFILCFFLGFAAGVRNMLRNYETF